MMKQIGNLEIIRDGGVFFVFNLSINTKACVFVLSIRDIKKEKEIFFSRPNYFGIQWGDFMNWDLFMLLGLTSKETGQVSDFLDDIEVLPSEENPPTMKASEYVKKQIERMGGKIDRIMDWDKLEKSIPKMEDPDAEFAGFIMETFNAHTHVPIRTFRTMAKYATFEIKEQEDGGEYEITVWCREFFNKAVLEGEIGESEALYFRRILEHAGFFPEYSTCINSDYLAIFFWAAISSNKYDAGLY